MKYDGVVVKFDKLYLFLLDPDKLEILDGINISDHKCYDNLQPNQLMVVNVIFKDGTEELENVDLEEFIYGDSYGRNDVFLFIYDVYLFTIAKGTKKIIIEDMIEDGEFVKVAKKCIISSKQKKETEKENV